MQDSSSQYSFSELLGLCDEFKALSFAHKDEIGQKDAEDWINRFSSKSEFFVKSPSKLQPLFSRINEAIVRVLEEALHRYDQALRGYYEDHPDNADCKAAVQECNAFYEKSAEGKFESHEEVKEQLKDLAGKAQAFLSSVQEAEKALSSKRV